MKHGGKLLACVVGSLAFGPSANAITADTAENPYQSIVDRNVFSLKPPPPPADPSEANKPQALKITLTGITTILGNKRVLMKTAPPPGKPGEAPKTEQSYILTEGQREGEIEVISIDEKAGSVKVSNAGTVQTLTFEKDGAKLPATPAPAAPAPGGPAPIPGLPVARPAVQSPANSTTPSFQLPTRIPRLPTPGAQTSVSSPGAVGGNLAVAEPAVAPGYLPGNVTSPAFQNTSSQNPAQASANPAMSLEEQAIMIEANRMRGGPGAALLPPTILTPKMNEGATPAQTPVQQNNLVLPTPGRPIPPGQY
jgi:hypothetical protein